MPTFPCIHPRVRVSSLLFAEAATVSIAVLVLSRYFAFPDVLRMPASQAFVLYKANQEAIRLGYYVFLASSLLYIPLSYQLSKWFGREEPLLGKALIGLGITTAIFQSLGFIRWIFAMPFLTDIYFDSPAQREQVSLIYEMLNRYAGMSVGEHLGFMAMGAWTVVLGLLIRRRGGAHRWIGDAGILTGILIVFSIGEHFGGQSAAFFGMINFLSNSLWTLWIITIGIALLLSAGAKGNSHERLTVDHAEA